MELSALLLQLLTGIGAVFVFLRWMQKPKAGAKPNLPPEPPSWPLIGHLHLFLGSPHPHREMHRLAEQYGPILHLRMAGRSMVLISSPDMAREVLKNQDRNFASRPPFRAFQGLGFVDGSIGTTPYGPQWRYLRKVATLELLTHKRIHQFAAARQQEMCDMVLSILDDAARDVGFDLNQKLAALTMNLMTRQLFGKRFFNQGKAESEGTELKRTLNELFHMYGIPMVGDHSRYLAFLDWWPKKQIANLHAKLDKFLGKELEEHKKENEVQQKAEAEQDFMDVLLSLPAEEGAVPNTDNMIKGLILDLIGAGVDTSSVTMEWAMAEVIRNPDVMKQAHKELDFVVGRDRRLQESDISNLPYLQAIVKESMRVHPAVAHLIPHAAIDSCQVAGYDIPAGMQVLVNIWSIAQAKSVWDSPTEFNPERFVGRDFDITGQNFEFIPFGAGRRGCPGIQLGLTHVYYAVAQLLHSFDWQLPQGQTSEHMDMKETFGLTMPKTVPLQAVATPRLPPHLYY